MWSGWIKPKAIDIDNIKKINYPPSFWKVEFNHLRLQLENDWHKVSPIQFDDITFYTAPFIPKRIIEFATRWKYPDTFRLWGVWNKADKSIVLLEKIILGPDQSDIIYLIRHEMTHAILDGLEMIPHDPKYFNSTYENVL